MNHQTQKTSQSRFALRIIFVVLYFYFILIALIQPTGVIAYTWQPYVWFPVTTFVLILEGKRYFKIYKALLKGKYGMNTLVGFSVHVLYIYSTINAILNWSAPAYSYNVMWEGVGMLLIFVQFGDQMMFKLMNKSTSYQKQLSSITTKMTKVLRKQQELTIPVNEIRPCDVLVLRHGDLVVVDGVALSSGIFNYENITGESKRVIIAKNKPVLSGSYNSGNSIKITVLKSFANSYISTIIASINRFSKIRPAAQQFADKILKSFVPFIFGLALITFLIFFVLAQTTELRFPWPTNQDGKINFSQALSSSVAIIAIACPCAIGMATPIVYSVTSIIASKNGIIINNPRAIEGMSTINALAFDKTGTITDSKMDVVKLTGNKTFIPLAKALEQNIKHPIAQAITQLPGDYASSVTNVKLMANGVTGRFKNKIATIKTIISDNNHTNLGLFVGGDLKLEISLKSKIKDGVKQTIEFFNNRNLKTMLISGDNKQVCLDVGKQININEVHYEQTPLQKTTIIDKLQNKGQNVVFVGDGFNDSPAMQKANLSIAFASGSDITNSLSDISLVNLQFQTIEKVFKLSQLNNRRIKWSLLYAFLFNVVALPLAILGFLAPWIAAIIMSLSNILVGLNGFHYLRTGYKRLQKM